MSDEDIEFALNMDEKLANGCEDTETLLQAAKEQVIELKKLKDQELSKVLEEDKLSYGCLAAFISELEAIIYNTENFIKKLEESHTVLLNSKTMYAKAAAKNLKS